MPRLFGHFVVAMLLSSGIHLGTRETCLGVHVERRERVGNRHGGDVGRFRRCRFRGQILIPISLVFAQPRLLVSILPPASQR